MSDNKITIMPAQMKAIARYEDTFAAFMGSDRTGSYNFEFGGEYKMTLEDLYTAVVNMLEKNPTVEEFGNCWYYPLTEYSYSFGIEEYCEFYDDDDIEPEEDDEIEDDPNFESGDANSPDRVCFLPLKDSDMFTEVWIGLEDIWSMEEEDAHLKDIPQLDIYRENMRVFLDNRNKPVEEREFTDTQKQDFIELFQDDDSMKNMTDTEIRLCRKFTDELCAKDSLSALRIKGYGCYGGNRIYPCDWKTSRDCIMRLYELTDDPVFANTLGYIYYYGRCTDGEPEYDKAFGMFSVAAANGMHEGMYKLADMYYHGYACRKSPGTANSLYRIVYEDCYRQMLEGHVGGSFTDAALRMGNVYLKGIDENTDPVRAFTFYLQAEQISKLRSARSDFFGNTTVAIGISKAKAEARSLIDGEFFKDYLSMKQPWIFGELVKEGYRADITFVDREDGPIRVRISRLPYPGSEWIKPVLITIPEIEYCDVMTELELEAYNLVTSFNIKSQTPVRYDYCEWNYTENRFDFFFNDVLAGWIACDEYRINRPFGKTGEGKNLRFVSVAFKKGGRTYDYLCDIEDISIGDKVIVPGYNGDTEVEVLDVYIKHESDLGIPLERYKKVIAKA